jgi:hypothetical protein
MRMSTSPTIRDSRAALTTRCPGRPRPSDPGRTETLPGKGAAPTEVADRQAEDAGPEKAEARGFGDGRRQADRQVVDADGIAPRQVRALDLDARDLLRRVGADDAEEEEVGIVVIPPTFVVTVSDEESESVSTNVIWFAGLMPSPRSVA